MRPLEGVTIVDLTRVLAGPFATMTLGDMGADVIKVELPGTGDISRHSAPFVEGESHYFLSINRNKRSIALDLKNPEGLEVCKRLIARADVVLENFRPGVMQQLGLGYEELSRDKPDLVMCSISGFGQEGPLSGRPAFDVIIQALSGAMSINGEPDGPPTRLGLPMGDLSGGLFACIGILGALRERDRTGKGSHVDIALYDCMVGLLGYLGGLYFTTGESPSRVGSGHHSVGPIGAFTTADGHIVLGIFTGKFWRMFCAAIGREDLAKDPRFARTQQRVEHMTELRAILDEELSQRSTAEWEALLLSEGIPASRIMSVGDVLEHEHTLERGLIETLQHPACGPLRQVGPVIKYMQPDGDKALRPPPLLGEHSVEVLRTVLGLPDDEIARLVSQGAVAATEGRDE